MMVYANQTPKSKFKNARREPKIVLFLWAAMVTEVLLMSKVAQTKENLDCEVVFTFQAMSNMRSITNIAFVTLMSVTVIDAKWNFAVVLFQILKCAEILLNVINQVKSVFLEIGDFCWSLQKVTSNVEVVLVKGVKMVPMLHWKNVIMVKAVVFTVI